MLVLMLRLGLSGSHLQSQSPALSDKTMPPNHVDCFHDSLSDSLTPPALWPFVDLLGGGPVRVFRNRNARFD